jgi:hypothetical protein
MAAQVLAGPILRRTTRNRVCVWLAASAPMPLQLTVMDEYGRTLGRSEPGKLEAQRVRLGERLYVYLLQARAAKAEGYPLDAWMYYQIEQLGAAPNERTPLFSEEELEQLVYGSHAYPSFFIPAETRCLLHGSCRKPHGGFSPGAQKPLPDALIHGHRLLARTADDMQARPSLLLTGDQIYADDVPISLLARLREVAVSVTGKQETMPLAEGVAGAARRLDPSEIPLHGRKQVLDDEHSGFSSEQSHNHLFTFGEFAAMYLYVFGNLPGWEPMWHWEKLRALGVVAGEAEELARAAWAEQGPPLLSFATGLPSVRRLMANVPTYMIFDDHDVTDDWNITGNWYDEVRFSPLGRRIVSNALAAYWAFQGWGNDPDNFSEDLVVTIRQQQEDTGHDPDIGERYDLHTWKSRGWGFSIPADPPIIAIDSRTQRQYDKPYCPAQLLDRYALDWLRVEWAKLRTQRKDGRPACPVLITTTPIAGYAVVEHIQHMALRLVGTLESQAWLAFLESLADAEGVLAGWLVARLDAESWSANRQGYVQFMDTLSRRMGLRRCVFLSGDVHYAYTAQATFRHQKCELHYIQCTSSSLSNEPDEMQARFLEKSARANTEPEVRRNLSIFPGRR